VKSYLVYYGGDGFIFIVDTTCTPKFEDGGSLPMGGSLNVSIERSRSLTRIEFLEIESDELTPGNAKPAEIDRLRFPPFFPKPAAFFSDDLAMRDIHSAEIQETRVAFQVAKGEYLRVRDGDLIPICVYRKGKSRPQIRLYCRVVR